MCKGFLYSLKHDVDFRVFLAQCFGAFSSFIFSIFVMPDKWLLTTIVLSFLLSYLLWRIFPGGLAFFISVLLLVGTAVYVTFPIAGTIVFGIQEFRNSYRPHESDISRGPLITRPHEDITFASELEMKDFNATELAEVLGTKLGISSKMFRIRIRSEKPFTFVLEVYPPAEAKESELNKTIAQLIGEIKRLLSEQNEFRKFKMREHYTETFSSEDEILGGEAVVELIYGPRITLSGKNDICEGEIANITFNMDGTGPWNITYYDQYGREYSLFTTISPYTQSIRVNSSRVFSLEAPERHTPTRSSFFDTTEPEIIQVVHVSHDRFCPAYLKLGKAIVDVHPIPAADIYGGGIICEGDTANISITIDGVPPFSIVYTAGDGSIITESELQSNIYSFKYGNNGDFQIQSVASSHCINNTKSQIVPVRVNPLPTATVSSGRCMYEVVMVKFTGEPPYSLTYSTGEEDITQRDIFQSPYLISGDNPHYIFKNISDRNCRGKVIDGPVHVDLLPLPEAHISGSGSFFEGGFVELTVELTGTPPWTFTYTSGNAHETINVDYTPYKIRANKEGKYRLASVRDANCAGTTSGSSTVTMYKLPSAVVKVRSDPKTIWDYTTKICEGAQAQVRFELSGSPPFRVSYTDGKENFTLQNIDDFEYIFNTRIPGVYRLTEIEDVYKNIVVLHVSANIETISLPTAKITGAGEYCEDDPAKLDVSFTGSPPWFIVYKQNKKVKRETNINQMPYSLQVTEDGTYTLETVGDRYCTNGNLDESTSTAVISRKPLPSCTVLGGHVIGQDLVVNCTGTPPYTFIYTEGVNQITKQSNEPEFRIPTESSGWYNFLEVVDNTGCRKLLQSSQFVNELPKAVLIKGKEQICEGETSELTITLTGSPPWTVTLSKNGHLSKIENVMSSPYTYVASEAGIYKLVAVGDSNSRYGTVEGEAEVSLYHTPAAVIEGGGEICANERANLTVHLTGTPPWTFSYTNGSVTKAETMVEHSPIQISVRGTEMSGRIWIAEVSDSHNCLGKPTETFVEVVVYQIPKAHLSGGGVICVGSKTYLNLTLSGEPPFYIEYTDGETVSSISNILISPHLEEVEKAGTYYLTAIQDRHCSYRRKK